jgi:phosphoglycolate phosphatase
MTSAFQAVIFDFDYTLADSTRGVLACIGYALAQMGLPPVAEADACRTIGLALPEAFRVLTGEADVDRGETFARLFVDRAEQVMTARTRLLPQTHEAVRWLRRAGYRLAIVSTKYRRRIREVLARDGLLDAFDVIVGGEDVSRLKPDPEGLDRALDLLLAQHAIARERVLYIGDSVIDARAASAAGLPFVAVLSGTTPPAAFAPYAPYALLHDVGDLPELLTENTVERSDG